MSAGSPRITVRVSQELLDEIQEELESQREHSPYGPEDLSAFITRAIVERIAKRRRSRASRRSTRPKAGQAWPLATVTTVHQFDEE